jgi:hypothetical protein
MILRTKNRVTVLLLPYDAGGGASKGRLPLSVGDMSAAFHVDKYLQSLVEPRGTRCVRVRYL